ncbi:hypothetical protein TrVE_jg110 [Triparma verrucosa]|uniref:Uncharacterized protein n=1 Tax=Triparma verrucosa TaxID=1606542 RepID=A0A9W7FKY4_9STRA|nr:hypothetical protein TrVE_jg110 [Triparma verrucosa]
MPSKNFIDIATDFGESPPHNTAVVIDGGETAIITGTAFTATSESTLEISYNQESAQGTMTPLSIYASPVQCTVFIDSCNRRASAVANFVKGGGNFWVDFDMNP